MVISHKNKYLFVELPLSGSTAISAELRENYDGETILRKHSRYHEFLSIASESEKKYFVFSGIRNPLDRTVSEYFKLKTNHKNRFTTVKIRKRKQRKFKNVQNNDLSFSEYLQTYYKLPYDNWSLLAHKRFDFVIRFESLNDDFQKVLKMMNLKSVRDLPRINLTKGRHDNFESFYTPEIRKKAVKIFGPFMKKWNYSFPEEWGRINYSFISFIEFYLFRISRYIHHRYFLRYSAREIKEIKKKTA